jgi:hypothetical protein
MYATGEPRPAELISWRKQQRPGDLQAAVAQLPPSAYRAEARPLQEELQKIREGRNRGPQLLGDILPIVLARLGVGVVQSGASGENDPR